MVTFPRAVAAAAAAAAVLGFGACRRAAARRPLSEDVYPAPLPGHLSPEQEKRLYYSSTTSVPPPPAPQLDAGYFPSFEGGELRLPARYGSLSAFSPADQARLRAALAAAHEYADIKAAFRDGYRLNPNYGPGMGIHMDSIDHVSNQHGDAGEPQFLCYVKNRRTGAYQLVQIGYIRMDQQRYKMFDSPLARGHFHGSACVGVRDDLFYIRPEPCEKGDIRTGRVWMMHLAVALYNQNGLFSDVFPLVDQLSDGDRSYSFYGRAR